MILTNYYSLNSKQHEVGAPLGHLFIHILQWYSRVAGISFQNSSLIKGLQNPLPKTKILSN